MKILKSTFILLVMILFFSPKQEACAQIWKKIKKKTQDKVENVIVDKTSDKAAEITAKKMDKALNAKINPFPKGTKKKDHSDLPDSYTFEWKYQLQMQTKVKNKKKSLVFDYYLSPGASYFGYSLPQMESMFTVMDRKHDTIISYMEQDGQPIATAFSLPKVDEEAASKEGESDYTMTKLPNKEFLGHDSKGVQLENSESRIIMYVATDTKVSFSDAFTSDKSKVPEGLKDYIGENNSGMIMYMNFINKKDDKKNIVMECISLDETMLVKNNGNYKFM